MKRRPKISLIIISFNTRDLTAHAIDSVFSTYSDAEVIVIDNNSKDDSVSFLKKTFGSRIVLVENKENVGFARANNQGVRMAHGDYVMLLNSDTVVHPGALDSILSHMEAHSGMGILAACLRNPDGSYQPQGGQLPTLLNVAAWWLWPFPGMLPGISAYQSMLEPAAHGVISCGWVGGTALTMRTDVFEKVGGLDEKIFMYAEDVDLCMRVRSLGLEIGIDMDAWITHLGMQSGSAAKARLGELKGLRYLFAKHRPAWQLPLLQMILATGSLLRLFLFGILKGNSEARKLYADSFRASL